MKPSPTSLVLAVAACAAFTARSDTRVATGVSDGPFQDCVRLSNGTAELVVCPALGRIVRYGWQGGTNMLWTSPNAVAYAARIGGWTNWGGDKAWIWPQDDWKVMTGRSWPPPAAADPGPYVCTVGPSGVVLTSPLAAGYGVRIVRMIELAPAGTRVALTTRLEPEPLSPFTNRLMAAWTVVQVPGTGSAWFARVADTSGAWRILGGGKGIVPPVRIGNTRVMRIGRDLVDWTKSGNDGDTLAARHGDTLFIVQTTQTSLTRRPEPGEGLQVCTAPDKAPNLPDPPGACVELEFTAPLAPRADVSQYPLHQFWSLHRLAPAADDAEVARTLSAAADDRNGKAGAR